MKQVLLLTSVVLLFFTTNTNAQLKPAQSQYLVEKGVLVNPSFEQGYKGWVITGCTKSLVTDTPYLNKSLKLTCTNETFSIKQVSTALTSFSKQQGAFDLQIKTTASGVNVSSITNGVRDNAYSVINSTTFKRFKEIGFIVGDTDNGIEVYSDTNFTGEIILDNVKLGLGNLTQEIGTAHFVGKVITPSTSNCVWDTTSTSYVDFPIDNDCPIPSVIGSGVAAPDTKKPAIKILNPRTDGYYKVYAEGFFFIQTGADGTYRLSDGVNFSGFSSAHEPNIARTGSNFSGEFRFEDNSDKTIRVQARVASGLTRLFSAGGERVFSLAVYFFPDSKNTIVSQDTELTAKTVNEFSARVSLTVSAATLDSQNYDWVTSVTRNSTGVFTLDYTAAGLTQAPSISAVQSDAVAAAVFCSARNATSTTASIECVDFDGSAADEDVSIILSKQGADVNKSQTIVGSFEQIRSDDLALVEGAGNGNTNLTANVTPVDFTETRDITSSWDGTTFTAPKTADYQIKGMIFFNALETSRVDAYVNTGGGYVKERSFGFEISSNYLPFNGILRLNEGDLLQILQTTPAVLSNNTEQHWISITELPTKESIVANLMQGQTTKCQTKYLSANVAGDFSSIGDLNFSNLTMGKKYRVNLFARYQPSSLDTSILQVKNPTVPVCEVFPTGGASQSGTSYNSCIITAADTSLIAGTLSVSGSMLGNATETQSTKIELCELPETVIETTEFN